MHCVGTVFRSLRHDLLNVPPYCHFTQKQRLRLTQKHVHVPSRVLTRRRTPTVSVHVPLSFTENSVQVWVHRDPVTHRGTTASSLPCQGEARTRREPRVLRLVSPARNVLEGTGLWPSPGDPVLQAPGRWRGSPLCPSWAAPVDKKGPGRVDGGRETRPHSLLRPGRWVSAMSALPGRQMEPLSSPCATAVVPTSPATQPVRTYLQQSSVTFARAPAPARPAAPPPAAMLNNSGGAERHILLHI